MDGAAEVLITIVALALLAGVGAGIGWLALRLVERAPAGRWRHAYYLVVGTALWGGVELLLFGSDPAAADTWAMVLAVIAPLVFVAWWVQRRHPPVPTQALVDAIPRARLWAVVAATLGAMAATWPIESDLVRAAILAVILAAAGLELNRLGRSRAGAAA